jgi:hypothetical protein
MPVEPPKPSRPSGHARAMLKASERLTGHNVVGAIEQSVVLLLAEREPVMSTDDRARAAIALQLARVLDAGAAVNPGSVSKELRATLDGFSKPRPNSKVEELQRRRAERIAAVRADE